MAALHDASPVTGPVAHHLGGRHFAHVTVRLESDAATGDDRDLVAVILSEYGGDLIDTASWRRALGSPSAVDQEPRRPYEIPADWSRAWRWSAVLPEAALDGWAEVMRCVNGVFGEPSTSVFDTRADPFSVWSPVSPLSVDELSGLSVAEAARTIGSWKPDEESAQSVFGDGSEEVARTLRVLVEADPRGWSADPAGVLSTLEQPQYIEQYVRGLLEGVSSIADRAEPVLAAIEPYAVENRSVVTWLIRALANADAEFASMFGWAWTHAESELLIAPEELEGAGLDPERDLFPWATAQCWGEALEGILSLARWEAVHRGPLEPRLVGCLDASLQIRGAVGSGVRTVLAVRHSLLNQLIPAWLEDNVDSILRDPEFGTAVFASALTYSQPTHWLLTRFRPELEAAVRAGHEAALSHLLIATLNEVEGYSWVGVLRVVTADANTLKRAIEDVAALVQDSVSGEPVAAQAVAFWKLVLGVNRSSVPAEALSACGRWTFNEWLADAEWLTLTARTVEITGGEIAYPIEVADRLTRLPQSPEAVSVLMAMIPRGESWERSYVQDKALEVLQALTDADDPTRQSLRNRLIELGRAEALDAGSAAVKDGEQREKP